jgi:single-strand DNA-binding protein
VVIATNDYYTNNKGEKVKQTEWHNLVAWGKTAELMSETLSKGNEIAIQGKLSSRSYEDKEGVTRYITEVIVNEFYKLNRTA